MFMQPGSKGISLNLEQWEELKSHVSYLYPPLIPLFTPYSCIVAVNEVYLICPGSYNHNNRLIFLSILFLCSIFCFVFFWCLLIYFFVSSFFSTFINRFRILMTRSRRTVIEIIHDTQTVLCSAVERNTPTTYNIQHTTFYCTIFVFNINTLQIYIQNFFWVKNLWYCKQ